MAENLVELCPAVMWKAGFVKKKKKKTKHIYKNKIEHLAEISKPSVKSEV